jgi:uncharacterized protein YceK
MNPARSIAKRPLCIILILLLSNCATWMARNPKYDINKKAIYPATRFETELILEYFAPTSMPTIVDTSYLVIFLPVWLLSVADLPISIITDTFLLPIDINKMSNESEHGNPMRIPLQKAPIEEPAQKESIEDIPKGPFSMKLSEATGDAPNLILLETSKQKGTRSSQEGAWALFNSLPSGNPVKVEIGQKVNCRSSDSFRKTTAGQNIWCPGTVFVFQLKEVFSDSVTMERVGYYDSRQQFVPQ